jgi:hypothetical protein
MKRPLESLVALSSLALASAWTGSTALAQGLPAPGPGGPTLVPPDGGNLFGPAIILAATLLGALILTVVFLDLRRNRRAQAIAIEGQIADALMREPRLTRAMITSVAHLPLTGRAAPTVEVRGEVEYPDLREIAVRVARQELLRYHPDGRVEDRIFVAPPVPAGRH